MKLHPNTYKSIAKYINWKLEDKDEIDATDIKDILDTHNILSEDEYE